MELLQVFDKDRNMLNESIARDKKQELPEGKYFMIILLFIQNSEGKFLLQKTSIEKNSTYATTGGHTTYGDDSITTAIKECEEELNIKLNKEELVLIDKNTIKCCHIDTYYVKKDINLDDIKLQVEEVEDVYWLTIDEIDELINNNLLRKGNIEPFNEVKEYIK